MKLIDFLISKGRSGWCWPNGMVKATCNVGSAAVNFYLDYSCPPTLSEMLIATCHFDEPGCISREQYEVALAASKPEWDGDGLPPVGSKVSFFYNERYDYNEEIIPQNGQELEVVAHKTTTDEHDVAVCYWDENGGGMAACLVPSSLRPIRSETDRKKEAAIFAIAELCRQSASNGHSAELIYDAIKSGIIVID